MRLESIFVLIVAVALSMSVHELAHGFVSYWMGDPTAKIEGRLSLNPFHHIDWVGMFCLIFFGFGWAKPVPIDSRYYKDQKTGIIWTSFAGPIANFLLAFVAVFLYYLIAYHTGAFAFSYVGNLILSCLSSIASLSTGFGIFNLLPIPPLDGSKILFSFLPDEQYYRFMKGSPFLSILFIALLWSGVLSEPIMWLRGSILDFFIQISTMILGI